MSLPAGVTGLVIATPCYGGVLTVPYFNAALKTVQELRAADVPHVWLTASNDSLVSRARNTCVAWALARPETSHLLFIDADIDWPEGAIVRLLERDRDIVAATYPMKVEPSQWTFAPLLPSIEELEVDEAGLVEIAACGAGFLLIKRSVFERMMAAHPELRYEGSGSSTPGAEPYLHDFFSVRIVDGTLLGEDFSFCRRWRDLGGQIWLDPTIILGHHGGRRYVGDPTSFVRTT